MVDLLQYQDDLVTEADVDKEHKRYLDKEKVILLNRCIFPSMANIVFFFRYMSRYPQLRRVFDNDIRDLLGVRREDPNEGNYGFTLSNFLQSVLTLGPTDRWYQDLQFHEEKINAKDFRLRLLPILYEIFNAKVCLALNDVLKNPSLQRVVEDDFNRTLAWTKILADSVDQSKDNDPPHRTLRFGTTQLREEDEWI
jgi:hypothetical protein